MFSSKFVDPSAIEEGEVIRDHEKCVRWIAHHTCEGFVKIFRLTHAERLHPSPNCSCGVCGSLISQRHAQITCVKDHRDGVQRRHHVFEQFETLGRSSIAISEMPVMLPLGREKLLTKPVATGS